MAKTFLKILFLFLPIISFSQKNLIEYAVFDDFSIKPFKELNITSSTLTGYQLNKKGKFVRGDKVQYTYNPKTSILSAVYLNMHDKPYNKTKTEFKADSLGNLYSIYKDDTVDYLVYTKDSAGRIVKTYSDSCIYNKKGQLIKTISLDSGQNVVSFANVEEYEYNGDTLKSRFYYRNYRGDQRAAGRLTEYIYENGILKGYRFSEKYFLNPKEHELHIFEIMENRNAVKESVYINDKLENYSIIEYGK